MLAKVIVWLFVVLAGGRVGDPGAPSSGGGWNEFIRVVPSAAPQYANMADDGYPVYITAEVENCPGDTCLGPVFGSFPDLQGYMYWDSDLPRSHLGYAVQNDLLPAFVRRNDNNHHHVYCPIGEDVPFRFQIINGAVTIDEPWSEREVGVISWENTWSPGDKFNVKRIGPYQSSHYDCEYYLSFLEPGTHEVSISPSIDYEIQALLWVPCEKCGEGFAFIYGVGKVEARDMSASATVTAVGVKSLEIEDAVPVMVGGREDWIIAARAGEKIRVTATPSPDITDAAILDAIGWSVTFKGPNNQTLPAGRVTPVNLKENDADPDVFSRTQFEIDRSVPAIYTITAKCGSQTITKILYVVDVAISRNNAILTDQTRILAGEQVNLSASLVPVGLPTALNMTNAMWGTLREDCFRSYFTSNILSEKNNVVPGMLIGNEIHFYYSKDGESTVSFSCSLDGVLLSKDVSFAVILPQVQFLSVTMSGVELVEGEPEGENAIVMAGVRLQGKRADGNPSPGILLGCALKEDEFEGGWISLVESINIFRANNNAITFDLGTDGVKLLDMSCPLSSHRIPRASDPTVNIVALADSPNQVAKKDGIFNYVERKDAFKSFFMVRPKNKPNATWVPVGVFSWGWEGKAQKDQETNVWTLVPGSTNTSRAAAITATNEFPLWTGNWQLTVEQKKLNLEYPN